MKAALTFFFSAIFVCASAQDAFFSQYNYGWSMLNPAYVGSLACARAEVGYRMQWTGFEGAPVTFNAAYDQPTKLGSVGLNYMFDEIGLMETNRFDFNYSYPLTGVRMCFRPAVQASYYNKSLDTAGLIFSGPPETFDFDKRHVFDLSFGLLAYGKRLCVGLAAFHLTEPDEGFLGTSHLPRRYVIHASGIIGNAEPEEKGVSIIPSALYMRQGDFTMFVGTVNVKFYGVNLGAGYRFEDALLFSAAYSWRDITVAYSYDYTISQLGSYSNGSHEIHIRYLFLKDKWSQMRNLRQFI